MIQQAIEVKCKILASGSQFLLAKAVRGTVLIKWDNQLSVDQNYIAAAKRAAEQWGWAGKWHAGWTDDRCIFVRGELDGNKALFEVKE